MHASKADMWIVGGLIPLGSCWLACWVEADCTLLHTCVVATLRCETIVYKRGVGIVGAGSAAYACQSDPYVRVVFAMGS